MDGIVSAGGSSVTELTGTVVAPAPECAIGFSCTGMDLSGTDVVPSQASHLYASAAASGGGSVTELTV